MSKIGIYRIKNLINAKVYIGQSIDVENRIRFGHIWKLENNVHKNSYLQNSWNKYGSKNFVFSIIEECEIEDLDEREQYWMDYYDSFNSSKGYNLAPQASSSLGVKFSDETKEKLSKVALERFGYDKEYLINLLKKHYEIYGEVLVTEFSKRYEGYPTADCFRRRFGNYKNALIEAGLYDKLDDYRKRKLNTIGNKNCEIYTKEEVIDGIVEFVKNKGRLPVYRDLKNKNGLPNKGMVIKLFGNLNNAIEKSGFKPTSYTAKRKSDEEMLEDLKTLQIEIGKVPRKKDVANCKYCNRVETYNERFGSIDKAFELNGMSRKRNPYEYTSDEVIEIWIKIKDKLGRKPRAKEIKTEDGVDLYKNINRNWKSYKEFIEEALRGEVAYE